MDDRAKIRAGIEAAPATREGRDVLVLHDRGGISPDLIVDRGVAPLLALMDGTQDLRDIQVTLMRRGGLGLVPLDRIQGFVQRLDDHLLLDNARYRDHFRELAQAYRLERVRPAAHAGRAYPGEPEPLRRQIEGYFQPPAGPGPAALNSVPGRLAGLILPHIDFQRGGPCYAWGYGALKALDEVDLFVILGTCHLPMELPFALTTKAFDTPLGRTPSAEDLAEAIARRAGLDLFRDELAHRAEHTIEFQVIFLQHLLDGRTDFRILPILCGGFHEMMAQRVLPSAHGPYARGLEALQEVLGASSARVCVIASADLAHLGPQFGDGHPIQLSDLGRIEREDKAMLDYVLKGNADGFYRHILGEGDRRRICGLPPIYTWLRLLCPGEARLLKYDQAYHPQFTVTFASIGIWVRG